MDWYFHISLVKPVNRIFLSYSRYKIHFKEIVKLFFKVFVPFYISRTSVWEFQFPGNFNVNLSSPSDKWCWASFDVLICHQHIFLYLLGELSVQFFTPSLKIGLFVLLSYKKYIYVYIHTHICFHSRSILFWENVFPK